MGCCCINYACVVEHPIFVCKNISRLEASELKFDVWFHALVCPRSIPKHMYIQLSVCLSVRLSVCLTVCPSVCSSVCLSVSLCVSLSIHSQLSFSFTVDQFRH